MANATNRWLDELAKADEAKGGTGSDYALAKLLGVARQTVSNYRRGVSQMDDDMATRLADLLGVQPHRIIGEVYAERAREERTRRMWMQLARTKIKAAVSGAAVTMTALKAASAQGAIWAHCIKSESDDSRALKVRNLSANRQALPVASAL